MTPENTYDQFLENLHPKIKLDGKYIVRSDKEQEEAVFECDQLLDQSSEWSDEQTEHFKNICIGVAIWHDYKKEKTYKDSGER